MAINPADYSRRVQTTVAHTFGSSQTGFVGLHTENSLPAEIFTTALNGGGDIRICTNSDGTGQLPLEVVEFDTVGSTAVLWFRMPTADTGSSVWVFYGKVGDTQPAVTDTYGRNAVWSDYTLVVHGINNAEDSSGNCTLNTVGTPTYNADGINVSPSNRVYYTNGTLDQNTISVAAKVKVSALSGGIFGSAQGYTVFSTRAVDTDYSPTLVAAASTFVGRQFGIDSNALWRDGTDNVIPSATDDLYIKGTYDEGASPSGVYWGDWSIYTDGVHKGTNNKGTGTYSGQTMSDGELHIGYHPEWNNAATLAIKDLLVKKQADSSDYTDAEYANQSSPATFWTVGTPEDTSDGLTIIPSSIVSTLVFGSHTLATSQLVAPTSVNSTLVIPNPDVTMGAQYLNIPSIDSTTVVSTPEVKTTKVLSISSVVNIVITGIPIITGGSLVIVSNLFSSLFKTIPKSLFRRIDK